MFIKNLNAVVIDDDSVIRNVLKILISNVSLDSKLEVKLYSSSDGVDGLGLIYISNPDLIIIDSTLPKYSGREIIEYLSTNQKYRNKSIVVLNDDANVLKDLPPNYKVISKSDKDFVKEITNYIKEFFNKNLSGFENRAESPRMSTVKSLVAMLIRTANRGDLIMHRISNSSNRVDKTLLYLPWIFTQIISSFLYTILMFVYRQVKDSNIEQGKRDLIMFRVRTYPTLIAILVALMFLFLQLTLFLAGGLIIFSSVRVDSVFADYSREVTVSLSDVTFNQENIENVNGILRLKPITKEVIILPEPLQEQSEQLVPNETDLIEEPANLVGDEVNVEKSAEQVIVDEPQNQPITETQPEEPLPESNSEVLGISTTQEEDLNYPTTKEEIIFNTKIPFTNLTALYEDSSFNTRVESSIDINAINQKRAPKTNLDLQSRILPVNGLTYQLSPDKINWYYYSGGESKWEITTAGFVSSNTVQEINQYLQTYVSQVGGNDLYIKAIFSSDGNTQLELRSIVVEREIYVISQANPAEDIVQEQIIEEMPEIDISSIETFEVISYPASYAGVDPKEELAELPLPAFADTVYLPTPTIYQAASMNGKKIIYGKVLASFKSEDISKLKVRGYFTQTGNLTSNSITKGDFIVQASLNLNSNGELIFLIEANANDGGLVTVELVLEDENREILSPLSKPLQS